MNPQHHLPPPPMSRRDFLARQAGGIGAIALSQLLGGSAFGASKTAGSPFAPRTPHLAPRAKNVIFMFMAGGPSHLDLLDPKPQMRKWDGQPPPKGMVDAKATIAGAVMASPREFTRFGKSGLEFSDLLPHTGAIADELCVVRSLHTDSSNHDPAQLLFNCGTQLFGHPSLGSWVNYGLGSLSQDMPGYVVLNSGKDVEARAALMGNGFLPSTYSGVTVRTSDDPILFLKNPPGISQAAQRARLDALRDLNQFHLKSTGDAEIASRIESYEMAFRMQAAAPGLLDLTHETAATRELYGLDQEPTRAFGTNCLLARRLVEHGVRFVQLFDSSWDDHNELDKQLKTNCLRTDQPAAALVRDLKQRGLLEDTLVIWAGEFGRTPMAENHFDVSGPKPGGAGRDHHPHAFSIWMAGGGVKPGHVHGMTDDFGYHVVEDGVHIHDLHATILHLLGLNHEQLTHRHVGRDFRLTDVAGKVVKGILA
ncbi:DUF1501 domain-containing protein [Prosthecobacter sp. SYSU 5D2]|uniref:DUF1501 domain-containing protein n=1 Tax=Prosthecobacter sp. SYSU 5D2 TaxID=3134134 RepID=UPI0031FED754